MGKDDGFTPRVGGHLWLETEDGALFGPGRIELLAGIDTLGSLNKAAKAMGMSYRDAWGRIREMEARMGQAMVAKLRGRGGYSLTPYGRDVVERFQAWHADVEAYALERARKTFPWPVQGEDDAEAD